MDDLTERVAEIVEAAPPISDDLAARLRVLLAGASPEQQESAR